MVAFRDLGDQMAQETAGAEATSVRRDAQLRLGVITAFPPGRNSLNEFGFHFVNHLAAQPEVAEVVLFSDETDAGDPQPSAKITVHPAWRFNAISNLRRVVSAVRAEKVDAVILNLQFATFGDKRVAGGLGLLIPLALRLRRIPSAVILHNLADNVDMQNAGFAGSAFTARLLKLAGRILTRALLRADYVALTIPRYVEYVRQSYRAKNVLLAPHGSFYDVKPPSWDLVAGRRKIMAFGKWGTYKTVDVLVEAYRELLNRGYTDLELVLAGTDSPNSAGYMANAAKQYADLPHITFPGYIEEGDVEGLFTSSAVVAFPYSSTTGSSGVLHQAGEYGRAAVLPRIGDLLEIIEEEGFRGVYFEAGDPVSLADAIGQILDDPELRVSLGKQNFAAAAGIPMSEVVHWHVIHLQRLLKKKAGH